MTIKKRLAVPLLFVLAAVSGGMARTASAQATVAGLASPIILVDGSWDGSDAAAADGLSDGTDAMAADGFSEGTDALVLIVSAAGFSDGTDGLVAAPVAAANVGLHAATSVVSG